MEFPLIGVAFVSLICGAWPVALACVLGYVAIGIWGGCP